MAAVLPEASGSFGDKPTLTFPDSAAPAELEVQVLSRGDGDLVEAGQDIEVNYLGQSWGGRVFDNSYDRKTALLIQLAQGSIIDGWRYALTGKKVGSRVEFSVPPTWGYGKSGNTQAGIKGTDTLVFVADVQAAFNAKSSAQGKKVPQTDAKLPTVGTNTDGTAPEIKVPKTGAPKELVAEYILEGDGPVLKATSTVLVQYQGVLWENGKLFDSSYERGAPALFSLQQVVKGWAQGLAGKKVGSRVLVVVPPSLGYGNNPPSGTGIKKDSTLVFSVDILAAM